MQLDGQDHQEEDRQAGAKQVAGDVRRSQQPGRDAHLAAGHQVRHVPLVRPLREVAAELEQRDGPDEGPVGLVPEGQGGQ